MVGKSKSLEKSPDGATAVRLTACLKATGVQTKPRNARINVDEIGHDKIKYRYWLRQTHCGETAQLAKDLAALQITRHFVWKTR
ncbi:hypothetical protein [Bradyrhizobium sp. AS23.2]|uniref:hypothetical protein n=1 Tax=Bradyrhizobium sp. AS23.2 TaxID=1680155 RepID=UPI00142F6088|nr:hypothetical protein [Bradyrhizobium sp. AS23.2]